MSWRCCYGTAVTAAKELSVRYCSISGYLYIVSIECLRSAAILVKMKVLESLQMDLAMVTNSL